MRALLDVNVLIALLDADHVHHASAHRWLEANLKSGWASCPITQNGCVRIMSQRGYPNPLPAAEVAERLAEAASTKHHRFWPDDVSLLDPRRNDKSRLLGPRQVTDVVRPRVLQRAFGQRAAQRLEACQRSTVESPVPLFVLVLLEGAEQLLQDQVIAMNQLRFAGIAELG